MAFYISNRGCVDTTAGSRISVLRSRQPWPGASKPSFEFHPGTAPIGNHGGRPRFLFIDTIAAILCELFHGVVVSEDVAMNATQKRDGNFQNRNKKVIRRLAVFPARHCRPW